MGGHEYGKNYSFKDINGIKAKRQITSLIII